jgi:hypothetical protein
MFNKLGQGLRWLDEKTSTADSWLGHRVGGALTAVSPAVSHFSPVIGAGVASAGLILKGVGALGDAEKAMLTRGEFHPRRSGAPLTAYAPTPAPSGAPTPQCAGRATR